MNYLVALLLISLSLVSTESYAFGKTGHRVVGQVCQDHLSKNANSALSKIMAGETLADAATWPDEMRRSKNNTFWSNTAKWHYVNIPANTNYAQSRKSSHGDVVVAIEAFSALLEGKPLDNGPIKRSLQQRFGDLTIAKNKREIKQFAVRFLLHLIGDLHQPLHAGYIADRGGNKIQINWYARKQNLHAVWDTLLLNKQDQSDRQLAKELSQVSEKDKQQIQESRLQGWLNESLALRKVAYDVDKYDRDFTAQYFFDNMPLINRQLQKAGLRAAKIFNDIFK
jgi:hypothetical protein